MIHLFGYIASLLIGISLGLIGGGGSILTMPVLVYLFGVPPVMATSYSLFVVGTTSLVGAVQQYKQGTVNIRMALVFASSSIVSVYLTRKWLVPAIPEKLVTVHGIEITENWLLMILFAILMLVSAIFMVRRNTSDVASDKNVTKINLPKLFLFGTVIGLITGVLGAGGGFLLIPALVLLLRLPMKEAVGTSLLVIATNSLVGFTGGLQPQEIDWKFLLIITLLAILGIMAGNYLGSKVASDKLKVIFGWFVFAMGVFILVKEVLKLF